VGNVVSLEQKQAWMREKHSAPADQSTKPTERHYTVAEVAAMWSLSDDAVRKIFEGEPGVLVLGGSIPGTRRYRTLRIPASVLHRVHKRLTNV
jgi:hypothetical protein